MRKYSFEDLIKLMEDLRERCPWDREQTHESLKKYLIEETYEVLEAIEKGDDEKLKEELGDLLLQPVFHAQIAKERSAFSIEDVVDLLVRKLKDRHPHVFGNAKPEEVIENWERRKMESREDPFEGIPNHLPALMKSQKIQERMAKKGFGFRNIKEILDKVEEEFKELKEALIKEDRERIDHELGDLLTAVSELARLLNINAEESLQRANKRLMDRFRRLEKRIKSAGKELGDLSFEELEKLWEEIKRNQ